MNWFLYLVVRKTFIEVEVSALRILEEYSGFLNEIIQKDDESNTFAWTNLRWPHWSFKYISDGIENAWEKGVHSFPSYSWNIIYCTSGSPWLVFPFGHMLGQLITPVFPPSLVTIYYLIARKKMVEFESPLMIICIKYLYSHDWCWPHSVGTQNYQLKIFGTLNSWSLTYSKVLVGQMVTS